MQEDDKTLDQTGKDLVPESDVSLETPTQGDDPLDLIVDHGTLLAEAKKFRAIAHRKTKAPEPKPQVVEKKVEVPMGDFVRRSDLERSATREAKELIGTEIAAEYEELVKIPLGGYDPLDARSIADNLKERYAILKARKPEGEKKEDVSNLSASSVTVGTGAGVAPKSEQKNPPNFKLPKSPKEWYPLPKQE